MTLHYLPLSLRRAVATFLAASSVVHLSLILCGFVALRVFMALRDGIVVEGDGAPEAGAALGLLWTGELTFGELLSGPAGGFVQQRSSQLLYPLLISFHRPLGLDVSTYLLLLNTTLGVILIVASYFVGVRLLGKSYGVLVALLMCSLTGPYWIARFAVVDNAFYAIVPLAALSALNWDRQRTGGSAVLMAVGFGSLAMTRPESMLIILSVIVVLAWSFARRSFSRRTVATVLVLSLAIAAAGSLSLIRASPSMERSILSNFHIAWGLSGSANTLLNRGGAEFDALFARYLAQTPQNLREWHYRIATEALATIRDNPLSYVVKIPLRGAALMFPWTYQPWSVPHVLYEAIYTIFIAGGLILLIRQGDLPLSLVLLLAIPLSIWLFLSAYLIDNDLKHRNGMLVAMNLIAPAGYFLHRRSWSEPAAHG